MHTLKCVRHEKSDSQGGSAETGLVPDKVVANQPHNGPSLPASGGQAKSGPRMTVGGGVQAGLMSGGGGTGQADIGCRQGQNCKS